MPAKRPFSNGWTCPWSPKRKRRPLPKRKPSPKKSPPKPPQPSRFFLSQPVHQDGLFFCTAYFVAHFVGGSRGFLSDPSDSSDQSDLSDSNLALSVKFGVWSLKFETWCFSGAWNLDVGCFTRCSPSHSAPLHPQNTLSPRRPSA